MTTLGKYELHEVLGKGGFGTVYRATDLTLGRVVAIKVLHPQLTVDPEFIERFGREARLMAQTEHPNIVGIYEVGEAQGRFFIAMRYLPGGSLATRLQRGPLVLEDIQGILGQVCAGLNELHRQGFIHRDLKPANILFDGNGQAVVTDFGLARAVQVSSSSSSSSTAGTPFYRAPELWRGKPPASPATDVYSLGCIMGEMLIGKPLFAGETPDEIITRHLVDGPDFGSPWPPVGVPRWLAEVVEQAINKAPARRYPDAQAFAQALAGGSRAEEEARSKAKTARQAALENEKIRLEVEAQTWRNAEANARRDCESQPPMQKVPTTQSDTSVAARVGSRKKIPTWGWLLGVPVLLGVIVLLALLFFSVVNIVPLDCTEIGQTWVSPVDGMTLVCVPAGKFSMGSNEGGDNEKPVHEVYLDAYWIDQTEVTNAMFAGFVNATQYKTTAERYGSAYIADIGQVPGADWAHPQGSNSGLDGKETHPVVQVSWDDAAAYCAWAWRRLPTEAQWEKAARGTDGRTYPWGNATSGTNLVNFGRYKRDTTAVGSYPDGTSPYGALDMAGNVWEWTADWYDESYYGQSPKSNPRGPRKGGVRVLRGGSWYNIEALVRTSNRGWNPPDYAIFDYGFRCSSSLP